MFPIFPLVLNVGSFKIGREVFIHLVSAQFVICHFFSYQQDFGNAAMTNPRTSIYISGVTLRLCQDDKKLILPSVTGTDSSSVNGKSNSVTVVAISMQ